MNKSCSELFDRVFNSGSVGSRRVCACGRTHFDSSPGNWHWEPGELEELERLAVAEPGAHVNRDDMVRTLTLLDAEIVQGCPCDTAYRYERMLLDDAPRIAEYLREHAQKLRERADSMYAVGRGGGRARQALHGGYSARERQWLEGRTNRTEGEVEDAGKI